MRPGIEPLCPDHTYRAPLRLTWTPHSRRCTTNATMTDRSVCQPAPSERPRIRVGIGGWNVRALAQEFLSGRPGAATRAGIRQPPVAHDRDQRHVLRSANAGDLCEVGSRDARRLRVFAEGTALHHRRRRLADSGRANGFHHRRPGGIRARLGPILWQLPPSRSFDADDLAAFLDTLPRELDGRRIAACPGSTPRQFLCERYVTLARSHAVPTVFTDSPEYPSLADLTGDFTYARLMRSADEIPPVTHRQHWTVGPNVRVLGCRERHRRTATCRRIAACKQSRDVFVFFISSAKHRNPAAAMALQARVDAG
jgi:uncharacterized protein YecE (DUF72 family)